MFRPESAPTVLDMSPEASLAGPPSVRGADHGVDHRGEEGEYSNGDDMSGEEMNKIMRNG